jgi:hypothetical protein
MAVKGSGNSDAAKKAKTESSGKEAVVCAACQETAANEKADKSDGPYYKIHRTKGHDLQECQQVEQLAENKRLNMKSVTRRRARMVQADLAREVVVVEEAVTARPSSKRRSLLEAEKRKRMMMEVTRRTTKSPVSRNSRRQLRLCALTEVHLCTLLTANSSSGRVKSMQRNRQ